MASGDADILVVGVGNELLGDEGVGVVAARRLIDEGAPVGTEVVEGAVGGIDLIFELEGRREAIIIDAARMGLEAGAVRCFSLDDVRLGRGPNIASLHQIGLVEAIALGAATGPMPEVHIVGVEPKRITPGIGLSAELEAAVPKVLWEVRRLAQALARET